MMLSLGAGESNMTLRHFDFNPTGKFIVSLAGAALLLAGCTASPEVQQTAQTGTVATQAAPPVVPRQSVNALMVTMIDNAGHVLWDVEKPGFAPKNDADWLEIENHATQLEAASTLIQLGGTGPEDSAWAGQSAWKADAKAMGDAAMAALAAAKSKNLQALVMANGALVGTCESCHKAFKPTLPTEGLLHQSPHSESHETNR